MATIPLPNTEQPSLVSPAVDPATNNDSTRVLSDADISRLNSQFQNEIITANDNLVATQRGLATAEAELADPNISDDRREYLNQYVSDNQAVQSEIQKNLDYNKQQQQFLQDGVDAELTFVAANEANATVTPAPATEDPEVAYYQQQIGRAHV